MRLSRLGKAVVIAGSILVGVAFAEVATSAIIYAFPGALRVCIETASAPPVALPASAGYCSPGPVRRRRCRCRHIVRAGPVRSA